MPLMLGSCWRVVHFLGASWFTQEKSPLVENKKKAKDLEMAEEKAEGVEMGEKKLKDKNMEKDYWI